jgi:hypothetical protein
MLRAVILTLFLLAFGLSGQAIYESSAYQQCSAEAGGQNSAEHKWQEKIVSFVSRSRIVFHCAERSIADNNPIVPAIATVVIAVFTTILGLFTMSLARSTRIAADATRRSADSDRPHMLPDQFKISGMRGPVVDNGKIKILVEYRSSIMGVALLS